MSTTQLQPDSRTSVREVDDLSFRIFIESVRDYALLMLDPTGRIISWNAGAEAIKGYKADEIIGRHFSTFYPPEAIKSGLPAHELNVAGREGRFEDEGWRIRKDGSRFWANVVITALRGSDGSLIGYAKVTRDLTERRRHEESLRYNEVRFRTLVEGVRDYAIFMLDPDGSVASWNAGAQQIHGFDAHDVIGSHFSRFLVPDGTERQRASRELLTAAREGRFQEEGWRMRKNGTRFWANVVITAIRDRGGDLARLLEDHARPDRTMRHEAALLRERGALPPVGRERRRLRHHHARRGGHDHQLEQRCRAHQWLQWQRNPGPALLAPVSSGRHCRQQALAPTGHRPRTGPGQ